jgi:diguanylate cyclase (GGDEF)-like protein
MLKEVSCCLKEILSYKLFAFAIQESHGIRIWIDPRIYRKPFEDVIGRDFGRLDSVQFHYLHEDGGEFHGMVSLNGTDLQSYALRDQGYFAKLYLMPGRKMFHYHSDIMNAVLNMLGVALANLMHIEQLESAASVDPLTQCYNKRELNKQIESHVANACRHGNELSVIMFDIDRFKEINDTYGHQAGDAVLESVSLTVQSEIRRGDLLARYGGDEFVAVLPYTRRSRAMELAERLRRVIETLPIEVTGGKNIKATASFGVACLSRHANGENLLKEADAMLYRAKANGRNRVMPQLKLFVGERQRSG